MVRVPPAWREGAPPAYQGGARRARARAVYIQGMHPPRTRMPTAQRGARGRGAGARRCARVPPGGAQRCPHTLGGRGGHICASRFARCGLAAPQCAGGGAAMCRNRFALSTSPAVVKGGSGETEQQARGCQPPRWSPSEARAGRTNSADPTHTRGTRPAQE